MSISCNNILDKIYDENKQAKNYTKWKIIKPSNPEYVKANNLDIELQFMRTIYLPYQKLIVISGHDKTNDKPSKSVFQLHMTNKEIEKLPSITHGRQSFAAYYNFEEEFIYVVGGNNTVEGYMPHCEKYNVYNQKWS